MKASSPEMFDQTQRMTLESTELPQYFKHLVNGIPIYKRLFIVKSGFDGDLDLYWAHYHNDSMAKFTSFWSERGDNERKGTATVKV